MDLELTREVLLLLAVWWVFLGTFLLFFHSSVEKVPIPLESIAGSPSEKRLYQRKRLPLAVSYAVLDKPEYQGTTLSKDISKGGVCISLPGSLQQGSRLRLSIQLPRVRRPLSLWGEVIWQAPRFPHPSHRFETEIRFIQLASSHILTIARSL